MLRSLHLLVFALVAAFGLGSGAHALSSKTALRANFESAPDRVGALASQARETRQESRAFATAIASECSHAARGAGTAAEGGANTVYRSVSAAGQVKYVGITNNLARRAAEHLASKGIQIEKVMNGLSRTDARSVEQALIEIHGLGKNGGSLMNRINSIAPNNPSYAQQVQRGYELLQSIGYQ